MSHFNTNCYMFTEKEYRQKRSRLTADTLFVFAIPIVVAVLVMTSMEGAAQKSAVMLLLALSIFWGWNKGVKSALAAFDEVKNRRARCIRLFDLAWSLLEESPDNKIVFDDGASALVIEQIDASSLRLRASGDVEGQYELSHFGVKDIGDQHIDEAEVDGLINEFTYRLRLVREQKDASRRSNPLASTGSTPTQQSTGEQLFRP